MQTINYQGIKYCRGQKNEVTDPILVEQMLQVFVNADLLTITMRTPGNDEALVRGLLYSEDVLKDTDVPVSFDIVEKDNLDHATAIRVTIDPHKLGDKYINTRNLLSVSSCGICGKTELINPLTKNDVIQQQDQLDVSLIKNMIEQMQAGQEAFKNSGGSHAAAAFTMAGEMLTMQEDIGRHNAVDKVIGQLLIHKNLNQAKCLLVSGRISYEIVSKCFMAGIPFLAAVSAPSSFAIDFAKDAGITLLAFCREDKVTVYANAERIKK